MTLITRRNLAMTSILVLAGLTNFSQEAAAAKSDIELGFTVLNYSKTTTETDFDVFKSDSDSTDLVSLEPNLSLNVFTPSFAFLADFGLGKDAESGAVVGAIALNRNVYAGLSLRLENKNEDSTRKPESGTESKDKTEKSMLMVGPTIQYRQKAAGTIIDIHGAIFQMTMKSKTEDESSSSTSSFKVLALQFGGSYHVALSDRFYLGAGLGYSLSLSGKGEFELEGDSVSGDYDLTSLQVQLLSARVEI